MKWWRDTVYTLCLFIPFSENYQRSFVCARAWVSACVSVCMCVCLCVYRRFTSQFIGGCVCVCRYTRPDYLPFLRSMPRKVLEKTLFVYVEAEYVSLSLSLFLFISPSVLVCVCVSVYMYLSLYIYRYIYIYMSLSFSLSLYIYKCTHAWLCAAQTLWVLLFLGLVIERFRYEFFRCVWLTFFVNHLQPVLKQTLTLA